jgi:hypothetical protein
MMDEKVEKIQKVSEGEESKLDTVKQPSERIEPNKERFDSAMSEEKTAVATQTAPKQTTQSSLMDTVRDLNYSDAKQGQATYASLVTQTQEALTQMEQVKKLLQSPDVKVKQSMQQLLNNKLSHIDESLKIALSKAGIEFPQTEALSAANPRATTNPIERFLSFVTDGQYQLQNLGHELETMSLNKKELSPVNMLAVQVKVGQIQQELELFSAMLSKGLESIKTIMNIQV